MPRSFAGRAALALCLLALAACQNTTAPQPTAPAAATSPAVATSPAAPTASAATTLPPAPQPTASAQPSAAPAATTAPQAGGLLPAPLYVLSDGQIWRIEADGRTRRQVTYEDAQIVDFDIAPTDNGLVYRLGEAETAAIVLLDAGGRTELLNGPVSSPRFAPDGARIAYQVYQPIDGLQIGREQGSDTGIYAIERSGGRPNLIQASDPITDTNNPPDNARQYYPVAFSPDGSRLLMGGYFPVGDGGFLAVKQLADGTVTQIERGCCEAAWSPDGAAVIIAGSTIVQDAVLGLWRADPRTGAIESLLEADDSQTPLVTAARQLADGQIYAFATFTSSPSIENLDRLAPQRVRADGTAEPLRSESYLLADALWAEDASGAVIAETTPEDRYTSGALAWLPTAGGAATPLGIRGRLLRWGNAAPQASANACGRFSVLGWQAPSERAPRPAVAELQRRLSALGYTQAGTPDGLYGDQTRAAVQAFQQANGLAASGDLDCATWAALLDARAAQ